MRDLPKRRFEPEFRAEAVKLVDGGVAQAEVARRSRGSSVRSRNCGWSATSCERRRRTSPGKAGEVRLHQPGTSELSDPATVPGDAGFGKRTLR